MCELAFVSVCVCVFVGVCVSVSVRLLIECANVGAESSVCCTARREFYLPTSRSMVMYVRGIQLIA